MADSYRLTLSWPYPLAKHVILTGTFDNWSKSIVLEKSPSGNFEGSVNVPYGQKTLYKFIVDGRWLCLPEQPTEYDNKWNLNNVFIAPERPKEVEESRSESKDSVTVSQPAVEKSSPNANHDSDSTEAVAGTKLPVTSDDIENVVDKAPASIGVESETETLTPAPTLDKPAAPETPSQAPDVPVTIIPVAAPPEPTVQQPNGDAKHTTQVIADGIEEEPPVDGHVPLAIVPVVDPIDSIPKADVNDVTDTSTTIPESPPAVVNDAPEPKVPVPSGVDSQGALNSVSQAPELIEAANTPAEATKPETPFQAPIPEPQPAESSSPPVTIEESRVNTVTLHPEPNGVIAEHSTPCDQAALPETTTPNGGAQTNGSAVAEPSTPPAKESHTQPEETPGKHSRMSSTDVASRASVDSLGRKTSLQFGTTSTRKKKRTFLGKIKRIFSHHDHRDKERNEKR